MSTSPDNATTRFDAVCVKWPTPTDEVVGVAEGVRRLVDVGIEPAHICLAVPNRNWAVQLSRACSIEDVRTSICIPPARLDKAAAEALAALHMLASPEDKAARDAWKAFGHDDTEAAALVDAHGTAKGRTLERAVHADAAPLLAPALLHLEGDEDAGALSALLAEQLARPTQPPQRNIVPIMRYTHITGRFSWVFAVACVDGFVPRNADGVDVDACRKGFYAACAAADDQAVASWFTRCDATLAHQARIRIARTRQERGREVAMCAPTPFLAELGAKRPPSMSGVEFSRDVLPKKRR